MYWSTRNNGGELPQESPVPQSDAARTINADDVLVKLPDFNDDASLIPLHRVGSCLVLDSYCIPDDQGWQVASMLCQAFGEPQVAVPECHLSGAECVLPCGMGLVSAWVYGDKIPYLASENAHCWRQPSVPVRGVPVLEHGTLERLRLQLPISSQVA